MPILAVLVVITAAARPLRAADLPEWRGTSRLGAWTDRGIVETIPDDGLTAT